VKNPAKTEPRPTPSPVATNDEHAEIIRRHLKVGWWGLLLFLTFGIVLEAMHGFKISYYLGVTNQTRRLMWTLAHAHGTLLALINLALAATTRLLNLPSKQRKLASTLLVSATILMPGGFFLGGLKFYAGDPGFGILLLPLGALFLFTAVFLLARSTKAI
jgi:hypothetical protein